LLDKVVVYVSQYLGYAACFHICNSLLH